LKTAQRKGFTLIELLVVIAIIAILAAILFPVFAKARKRAQQSACISNQKQIAIAMMTYLDDYDSKFPAWTPPGGTGMQSMEDYCSTYESRIYGYAIVDITVPAGDKATISRQLDSYVKSRDVWACPSDFGPYKTNDYWGVTKTNLPFKSWRLNGKPTVAVGVSYGYRGTNFVSTTTMTTKDPRGGALAGYSLSDVKQPAARAMFWDHRPWHFGAAGDTLVQQNSAKVNLVFFDSHVITIPYKEFISGFNGGFNADIRS
jgi:prepilin-type N-terminal cleavage/methylation domain-containing protein